MEERYHATTQNRFYPDMSNVNKNIAVEANVSVQLRIYHYSTAKLVRRTRLNITLYIA